MEQFNRVEIQGLVGSVRLTNFSDSTLANISVATNYFYNVREGQATAETTWFTVLARVGKGLERADSVTKGNAVRVLGRLRTHTYTDSEGIERLSYDVIANKVERLDADPAPAPATF
ncbi:MAG: single-stranded DNA-binding protein [Bacteroidales bacterium]|nr:single-stranded DNA-binding protein [Bacteroidales bacterium]